MKDSKIEAHKISQHSGNPSSKGWQYDERSSTGRTEVVYMVDLEEQKELYHF